jgi:hypothetical protein
MSEHLDRLARRVMRDPLFLAAPLARYAESQGLGDEALAGTLGCDVGTLVQLRLCRNPDPHPPNFWSDVERIARRFHLDSDILAEVVRFGQGLLAAQCSNGGNVDETAGYLMAARDDRADQGVELSERGEE